MVFVRVRTAISSYLIRSTYPCAVFERVRWSRGRGAAFASAGRETFLPGDFLAVNATRPLPGRLRKFPTKSETGFRLDSSCRQLPATAHDPRTCLAIRSIYGKRV